MTSSGATMDQPPAVAPASPSRRDFNEALIAEFAVRRWCIPRFPKPSIAGKAMFQMMGVFAEFERAMIAEQVRAGLALAGTP
jgi:hypothetical protein